MNLLKKASKQTETHEFDLVLDAVEQEVPEDFRRFVSAKNVMDYIRSTGDLPSFVSRHCQKVIAEERQPALL
jgi:hypothetical protein